MGFGTAIKVCFTKYFGFSGRACRSEYWWFALFCSLVALAQNFANFALVISNPYADHTGLSAIQFLISLLFVFPSLAVAVRRLHDIDKSGWWYLILLIPLIGIILLLVWFCRRGTRGPNRFGNDPLNSLSGSMDDMYSAMTGS